MPLDAHGDGWGAVFIIDSTTAQLLAASPEWVYRDPLTTLGNRHMWERERDAWLSRSGCIAFFDLDDLKEVNDLYGHLAGDRLLTIVGRQLAAVAPPDALVIRYGGDEFVVLWPETNETAAEAWAAHAVHQASAATMEADLPVVPRLSYGVASFGPGGLASAMRQADDRMYARKGVLLLAPSGGRIILTREGRAGLRLPGDQRAEVKAPPLSAAFGPEFEVYLRQQYARAVTQAQEFVAFVDPPPGSAVIEVGAGSGRITFDGGLAERIGAQGQLLVTDPSVAQLLACRRAAKERNLPWLRFLQTPAEHLPVASGTVDMVVGMLFLQFTDPAVALREMARVLRPGGQLALGAGLVFPWPPVWEEILAPVRQEAEQWDIPWRHFFTTEADLCAHIREAGMRVQRTRIVGPEIAEFHRADVASSMWRQNGLVPLLLPGVPPERCAMVQQAFDAALVEVFARTTPQDRRISTEFIYLVADKPA